MESTGNVLIVGEESFNVSRQLGGWWGRVLYFLTLLSFNETWWMLRQDQWWWSPSLLLSSPRTITTWAALCTRFYLVLVDLLLSRCAVGYPREVGDYRSDLRTRRQPVYQRWYRRSGLSKLSGNVKLFLVLIFITCHYRWWKFAWAST